MTQSTPPSAGPSATAAADCTVRVAAGEPLTPHLADGAVVCLGPGRHQGPVVVQTSLTLRGEPGAVLAADGRGAVVHVTGDGITVGVHGLTLTDGYAETGSGLLVEGWATVTVEDCRFEENRDGRAGGRGMTARRGMVTVRRTTFGPREDVVLTGAATAAFEDVTVEADLAILEGVTATLNGGAVNGTLTLRGTTSRVPTVTIDGTAVGKLDNDPVLTANLTVSSQAPEHRPPEPGGPGR